MSQEISLISLQRDPLVSPIDLMPSGQNLCIKELSRYLGAMGFKIDVYSRRQNEGQLDQEDYSRGARVIRIPIGPPGEIQDTFLIRYLKDIATWIPTYQIKEGLHYNLVHSHSYLSGPVGIHLKDTWGIPHIHTFYSLGLVEEEIRGSKIPGSETRIKIEKMICRVADRIIVFNSQHKTDLTELYQVDPGVISVIPIGVDLEKFQPLPQSDCRREIAFPDDVFLITYVGSLEERNGLDTLLEAIYLIDDPAIQVVIVGGTPSEKPFLSRAELSQDPYQKYIDMVDEYGLDKQVTFTGGKPQSQLAKYYSAGDISVVPSNYEPIGMTAVEALACGSPVIASRIGGLSSAVQENHVGALFEPGSAAQLAEKIQIFYDQPKINEEQRKNARPYAEEHFNWKTAAGAVAEIYQELLEKTT